MGFNLLEKRHHNLRDEKGLSSVYFKAGLVSILFLFFIWCGSLWWLSHLQKNVAVNNNQLEPVAEVTVLTGNYSQYLQTVALLVPEGLQLHQIITNDQGLSLIGEGRSFSQVAEFSSKVKDGLAMGDVILQKSEAVINQPDSVQFIIQLDLIKPSSGAAVEDEN